MISIIQVSIFGGLSEHAYPTGFGSGVVATFHRILELGYAILKIGSCFSLCALDFEVLLQFTFI